VRVLVYNKLVTTQDILGIRLSNQKLTETKFTNPAQVVSWLGAVQSQDFPGASWGIGQRFANSTHERVVDAFNNGEIIRTHVMRPTWHFVAPEDASWLLKLTGPRVKKLMSYYNRRLGLTNEIFERSNKIIAKTLRGKFLTRQEIAQELRAKGIGVSTQTLGHLVMEAELDAVICSGPLRDKKFTYALFEERVPSTKKLSGEESLFALAKKYFSSHGPATIRDFVWWSGLTTADAKMGIELNKFDSEIISGKQYWFETANRHKPSSKLYLLPNYDEYTIAYQVRDAYLNPATVDYFKNQGNAAFWNAIVYTGEIIGMWRRTFKKSTVVIQTQIFEKLTSDQSKKLNDACMKLEKFFNLNVVVA